MTDTTTALISLVITAALAIPGACLIYRMPTWDLDEEEGEGMI